jgi:hypothetical protein
MWKFFHGWRPKTGCVTLLLACALSAAWIRSSSVGDYLTLALGKAKIAVLSQENKLSIAIFPPIEKKPEEAQPKVEGAEPKVGEPVVVKSPSEDPKTGWWTVKLPTNEMKFVHYDSAFPYWSLVVPLVLVSAWLLLVKAREVETPMLKPTKH